MWSVAMLAAFADTRTGLLQVETMMLILVVPRLFHHALPSYGAVLGWVLTLLTCFWRFLLMFYITVHVHIYRLGLPDWQ